MPNRPPPVIHWYWYRVTAVAILVAVCTRLFVAYSPFTPQNPRTIPDFLRIITGILPGPTDVWDPVYAFGYAWLAVGVIGLLSLRWHALHAPAFLATFAGSLYFALAYLVVQLQDPPSLAFNSAWAFAITAATMAFCGLVTRMPPRNTGRVDG